MTARTFRRSLEPAKPILYPRGTSLAEIPPLARGLTWIEYLDTQIAEWKQNVETPEPDLREVARQFRAGDVRNRYGIKGVSHRVGGLFS